MKRIPLLFVLALCCTAAVHAENSWSFKGTVVKMQMTECVVGTGFKATMSGRPASVGSCPEYTVLGPTVVYVVVGRHTEAFLPMAEDVEFVVRKNEVQISEKSKSRFIIEQMKLRGDWEREEERKESITRTMERSASYEPGTRVRSELTAAK